MHDLFNAALRFKYVTFICPCFKVGSTSTNLCVLFDVCLFSKQVDFAPKIGLRTPARKQLYEIMRKQAVPYSSLPQFFSFPPYYLPSPPQLPYATSFRPTITSNIQSPIGSTIPLSLLLGWVREGKGEGGSQLTRSN